MHTVFSALYLESDARYTKIKEMALESMRFHMETNCWRELFSLSSSKAGINLFKGGELVHLLQVDARQKLARNWLSVARRP